MMNRYFVLLLAFVVFTGLMMGCSTPSNPTTPQDNQTPQLQDNAGNGRVVWDTFSVGLNPADGSAMILPNRNQDIHVNVTNFAKPPACYDCVAVVGSHYAPIGQEWQLTIQLRNPAIMAAYDVRGLVNGLGTKYLKNSDGFMNTYLAQDMDYKAFAKADPVRAFWPGATNQETYVFHFPPGSGWTSVDYIIDASWPGNCQEPIIENVTFPTQMENGITTADLTVTALDHQGEFFAVFADLTPLGIGLTPLFDDGVHGDGASEDGIFGTTGIKAVTTAGDYKINIYSMDGGSHYGWNSFRVNVFGDIVDPPVISEITMSRNTCLKSSTTEIVELEVILQSPKPGVNYHWSADGGQLTSDSGQSTTWKPPSTVGKYHVTCEASDQSGGQDSMQSGKIRVTKYPIITPAPAPNFTVQRCADPGSFSLTDYSPGNVCFINFWATWCGPCVAEFPHLQDIQDQYGEGVVCMELSIDSAKNTVASWIASNNYDFDEWGWDSGSQVFSAYQPYVDYPNAIPTTIIVDADRNVRFSKVGGISSASVYTVVIDELN